MKTQGRRQSSNVSDRRGTKIYGEGPQSDTLSNIYMKKKINITPASKKAGIGSMWKAFKGPMKTK